MSYVQHKAEAPKQVNIFVVTVSDTRAEENDTSGKLALEKIAEGGHRAAGKVIVTDDPAALRAKLAELLCLEHVDAVVATGGTGIGPRDNTYEVVAGLLDKRLDGFGEIFRWLSYEEIGTPGILSRAIGGVANNKVLLAIPGSRGAVRLAFEKLINPEIAHMLREIRTDSRRAQAGAPAAGGEGGH